jgi:hypothetical protein
VQWHGVHTSEEPGDPVDLTGARQEHEHVTVRFGQCGVDSAGDVVFGPLAPGRRGVGGRDRVGADVCLDHRRVRAQQRGDPAGRDGGRRREQPQVRPEPGAGVEQQRQQQVGVEVPLVDLVEDDRADAGQARVVLEPAHEQAGGDHLDPGVLRGAAVAADRVPDRPADGLTELPRHPGGGRPRREPAWLGDHDLAGPVGERERHHGRLAGARRRHEHRGARPVERGDHVVQHRADREVGSDSHTSEPRPTG